jgi:hypothetical protein
MLNNGDTIDTEDSIEEAYTGEGEVDASKVEDSSKRTRGL